MPYQVMQGLPEPGAWPASSPAWRTGTMFWCTGQRFRTAIISKVSCWKSRQNRKRWRFCASWAELRRALHNDNFNAIIKSKTAVEKGGCLAMMRYEESGDFTTTLHRRLLYILNENLPGSTWYCIAMKMLQYYGDLDMISIEEMASLCAVSKLSPRL